MNDADGSGTDTGCSASTPFCVLKDGSDPLYYQAGNVCVSRLSESWCTDKWLALSDNQLVALSTNGNRIGQYCLVYKGGPSSACNYYAMGKTSNGYNGVPRTTPDDLGTGCIDEDGGFCYMQDSRYNLTAAERIAMCSSNVFANAAAHMRHGVRNAHRYCMDEGKPLPCDIFNKK